MFPADMKYVFPRLWTIIRVLQSPWITTKMTPMFSPLWRAVYGRAITPP
jgi:hypothetical protein